MPLAMTPHAATISDSETDVRWRAWKAQGAERDRRTSTRVRTLMLLVAAAFAEWVSVLTT